MADPRSTVMQEASYDISMRSRGLGDDTLVRPQRPALLKPDRQNLTLERAVEFEIVPRLLQAHRNGAAAELPQVGAISPGYTYEVKAFAEMVLGHDQGAASTHVQALRDKGVPLEQIYLSLLAPTALHFRQLWIDDERDFAEVTLGLWRLQQLLREFSTAFRAPAPQATGLRALLAPGPGETQDLGYLMFGLVLVGEFFRRDGWDTWIEASSTAKEFSSVIGTEWFDVVEFLVSNEKRLENVAAIIKMVRGASMNRALGVVVCGPMFVDHPELALLVGGDMSSADPRGGAPQAQDLVHKLAHGS
jgi:hypothetical protein